MLVNSRSRHPITFISQDAQGFRLPSGKWGGGWGDPMFNDNSDKLHAF